MAIIDLANKHIENVMEAKFLAHLLNQFSEYKQDCLARHSVWLFDPQDPLRQHYIHIRLIPSEDFFEFARWCDKKNITVHMKSKMMKQDRIFWPIRIEIIIDNDNEEYVLFKLINY